MKMFKALAVLALIPVSAMAQKKFETELCEAAETNRTIEMVYDKDASKGCAPRLIDVHQVAMVRDFEAKRIFKVEKIKSVELIDGMFGEKSQAAKDAGWNGCIGSNCFIKENICE
jgi:hypothetical protein